MKHKNLRKNIEIGVLFGLVCAIILNFAHFSAACEDLKSSVLRLHIPANSNSEFDQEVKMAVRDRIIEENSEMFSGCSDLASATAAAERNIARFEDTANRVLEEYGADYRATAAVETVYFDTRVYEDFTLPAGYYRALDIKLGKAQGKNWWCVIFPRVCLTAASGNLSDSAAAESERIAENAPKYVMKFKLAEWYEELKTAAEK